MLAGLAGRAVAPADWHVTLCFLGALPPEPLEALQASAGQIDASAFALSFGHLEYWREARVLAATAAWVPQPARALADALRALACSVGITPDPRALRPHVTLMRAVPAQAWRDFGARAGHAGAVGPVDMDRAVAGRAAMGQDVLGGLTLQAREFRLAETREPSGRPAVPLRYRTLVRWPLRP